MNHKKKLSPTISNTALAILCGVVVGVLIYFLFVKSSVVQIDTTSNTSGASVMISTTTQNSNGTSVQTTTLSTTSTATNSTENQVSTPYAQVNTSNTSSWPTYINDELGFQIKYPSDLIVDTSDPTTFKVTFPKTYFSTQMIDTDIVSISVNATCTPVVSFSDKGDASSTNVFINGINFVKNTQYDMGAGSHTATSIYDTNNVGSCYRITFQSHGPNDAGVYVGDPATIAAMDAAHVADAAHISNVVNMMLKTFAFATTPNGENEADYPSGVWTPNPAPTSNTSSPTSGSPTSGAGISITSVSQNPVAVGGTLTVNGQGFSGHDTIVWISNGSVNGVLWGGMPKSDNLISATVPAKACTIYTGASGASCPSYLIISPGIYTLSVANQNGTTDDTYIKVQ